MRKTRWVESGLLDLEDIRGRRPFRGRKRRDRPFRMERKFFNVFSTRTEGRRLRTSDGGVEVEAYKKGHLKKARGGISKKKRLSPLPAHRESPKSDDPCPPWEMIRSRRVPRTRKNPRQAHRGENLSASASSGQKSYSKELGDPKRRKLGARMLF